MESESRRGTEGKQLKELIWRDYSNGLGTLEIAEKYNVSRSYCYQVISAKKSASDPELEKYIKLVETYKRDCERLSEENKKLKEEVELYKKLLTKLAD